MIVAPVQCASTTKYMLLVQLRSSFSTHSFDYRDFFSGCDWIGTSQAGPHVVRRQIYRCPAGRLIVPAVLISSQ